MRIHGTASKSLRGFYICGGSSRVGADAILIMPDGFYRFECHFGLNEFLGFCDLGRVGLVDLKDLFFWLRLVADKMLKLLDFSIVWYLTFLEQGCNASIKFV
ncbi:hypothetical protein Q3G72_007707 [Acer saccharum]|nr:hypothetical protein Q3G72_007707 [Acer saccharum]